MSLLSGCLGLGSSVVVKLKEHMFELGLGHLPLGVKHFEFSVEEIVDVLVVHILEFEVRPEGSVVFDSILALHRQNCHVTQILDVVYVVDDRLDAGLTELLVDVVYTLEQVLADWILGVGVLELSQTRYLHRLNQVQRRQSGDLLDVLFAVKVLLNRQLHIFYVLVGND